MKNIIKISNQLWTRKCNLSCNYCRIATTRFNDYVYKPKEYPNKNYYITNEKDGDWWIEVNNRLFKHNPNIFNILYGGEIFFHPDYIKIIDHMNKSDMNYTIISSANDGIKSLILKLFESVGRVKGFTCSIDPGFYLYESTDRAELDDDEIYKSKTGFSFLNYLIKNNLTDDPVAEITVDNGSIEHLEETVKILSEHDITSDITFIDCAYSSAYDFSNVTNLAIPHPDLNKNVEVVLNKLKESNYKIHMKDLLLDKFLKILPCTTDCGLDKKIHNISIDSDGKLRLCLRIRGFNTTDFDVLDLITENGDFSDKYELIQSAFESDYDSRCLGCNWSCVQMSKDGDCEDIINH